LIESSKSGRAWWARFQQYSASRISLASELLGLVPVRCLQDRLEVIVVVVQSSGSAFFLLFFVLFSPLP
jgi:hypothetical protein